MNRKLMHFKKWPALSALATLFGFATSVGAQNMPAEKNDDRQFTQDRDADRQRDTDRQDVARFDQFLDNHREIAEQVRKDPSLLDNKDFLKSHPALQTYLQQNPGVRDQIKQNPSAFMYQEDRYERHEDLTRDRNATRQETARFDRFLDSHREIAEQLRKNPALVNNTQFLKDHPALQTYLQDHPAVRKGISQDPNAFMQAEERYDQRENEINRDRDRDADHNNVARSDREMDRNANQNARRDSDDNVAASSRDVNRSNSASQNNANQNSKTSQNRDVDRDRTDRDTNAGGNNELDRDDRDRSYRDRDDRDFDRNRQERSRFDQFLDSHRETAEQLRKDPSLANNPQFQKNHPAFQAYLQDHPNVQAQLKNDPNAFMQQQDRFDRDRNQSVARYDRDSDSMVRGDRDRASFHHSASFGEFLGAHSNMAQQLSKDPSLVKSPAYMEDHPELRSYLDSHPEVKEELMQNPQGFIKSAQETPQFKGNGQVNSNGQAGKPPSAPTASPTKPKQ